MTAPAKRAVACRGWRWMPGMAYAATNAIGGYTQSGRATESSLCDDGSLSLDVSPVNARWTAEPALDDPATLGCFEHGLLPGVGYNDAHLDAFTGNGGEVLYGVVYRPDPVSWPNKWLSAVEDGSPTKAEALVAALEAAPQPKVTP